MSRRGAVAGVVTVVILAGGAVAVDVIARDRAEERIAEEVAIELGLEDSPEVTVGGTVFLPQVAGGSISHVRVEAESATLASLPMVDLVLELEGVSASEPYTAELADFTGIVPLDAVRELNDAELDISIEDGAVVVGAELLGFPVEATVTPVADGRAVVATVESLRLAGITVELSELSESLAQSLTEIRVPIDGLPEGMELTEVIVVDDGFFVTARGADVTLSS